MKVAISSYIGTSNTMDMKKIGLISDTHSYLDERLERLLGDCDEIWHAGDIGDISLLNKLNAWKPLRAVWGNIDDYRIRAEVPQTQRFTLEGVDVLMTHIGGYPGKYQKHIEQVMQFNPPQIFVAGHSHILKVIFDKKYNCLHLNPGACGRYGFHSIRTALRFVLVEGRIEQMEILELGNK